jgi:hypothetical protein
LTKKFYKQQNIKTLCEEGSPEGQPRSSGGTGLAPDPMAREPLKISKKIKVLKTGFLVLKRRQKQ